MSHQLLIDCGNTFLKWGRYLPCKPGQAIHPIGARCVEFNRALLDEIPTLVRDWRKQAPPSKIVISNVAGTRVRNPIMRALEAWLDAPIPIWITAVEEQCGVRNGYMNPRQLGSDRWASLIGAHGVFPDRPLLVAVCGTATTVDLLSRDGLFVGGTIMPGLGLMQRVLHEQTAALPDAQGEYVEHPIQTVDAIASGCAHAQVGAIERQFHLHEPSHPGLQCVISGGAAANLAPRLTVPFELRENLVLEGLYEIAQSI